MPTTSDRPWAPAPGGVTLTVRLTPRGGRDRIDGVVEDADGRPALAARVSSPPVDGAANKALVALIAKALKLRKSDVEITAGDAARVKRLSLSGDAAELAARLEAAVGRNRRSQG